MKKNDILTLEIESMTNLGFGVAHSSGIVVFVGGAVTGEVAEVKVIKLTRSYAVGRVEKIIKSSPSRDNTRCGNSYCSSCAFKSIKYADELKFKESEVKECFIKTGLADVKLDEIIPSPKCREYRNKAQYPIAKDKNGEYVVGFFAPKSHRVTEAAHCPLAPSVFAEIIEVLKSFFKKYSLSVYDEKSSRGLLRHIYIRRGEVSGEILLTLVINGEEFPHIDEFVRCITEHFPAIVGILLNVNTKNTNVILGEKYITLFGRDYIYDTLCGVELKISAPAFYQVNHDAAELLYKKARELAAPTKDDVLLDLYCGAGSIGLSMADSGCELIGIEIVESAVFCARENAARSGIENAKFYPGDAKNTENLLATAEADLGRKIEPTIILLDPPRAGCDEETIRFVASLSPKRIVYISCNPATLARDCAIFKVLGYRYGNVTPIDLFPGTGHVESVVCLTRAGDST